MRLPNSPFCFLINRLLKLTQRFSPFLRKRNVRAAAVEMLFIRFRQSVTDQHSSLHLSLFPIPKNTR